jgi:hypothetical protein
MRALRMCFLIIYLGLITATLTSGCDEDGFQSGSGGDTARADTAGADTTVADATGADTASADALAEDMASDEISALETTSGATSADGADAVGGGCGSGCGEGLRCRLVDGVVACAAPCPERVWEGGILLNPASQMSLAELAGYTTIHGSLKLISLRQGTLSDDLSPLACLEHVTGGLFINGQVKRLDGLLSLTSVGGSLEVVGNQLLTQMNGLAALGEVGGDVVITNNGALTSLAGLEGLTTVGGALSMEDNGALTSLNGLKNLTILNNLSIIHNIALASLDGLEALTAVGGDLSITGNAALADVTGLSALTTVGQRLYIVNNQSLCQADAARVAAQLSPAPLSTSVTDNLGMCP